MSRFPGRLTCVCALLYAAGLAQAAEVPGAHVLRFNAAAWPVASDARLDTLRGGFDFGGGLAISFGFVRSVTINGNLVSQIHFSLPDLSHITVDQAKIVSDALAQAHIVQNGTGNSAPVASAPAPKVPAAAAGASNGSPPVAVNTPVVSPPSINPSAISLPVTGLSSTTIVQNSLNNQILQSLTVIDAGVNSLGILRSMNIQGALRDALLGALGSH